MTNENLLSVRGLSRSFGEHKAIEDLNFEIQRGEVVALLGANGAGKSTTLNIICGNLTADLGDVRICNANISKHPKQAKANLGYLPDTPPLYLELSVIEYLNFAASIHGVSKQSLNKSVNHVLEVCGLHTVKNKLIANLSKGFKQRVGIAQAIVHNPALVILDEPTVGLDPIQMQDIRIIDQGSLLLDQHLDELNQSSSSRKDAKRVKLRFYGNPSVDELKAIQGCESVSCSQFGKYICRYSDMSFIQNIQTQSLKNDWQLYEMHSIGGSLEQVFLDLVMRDSASLPPVL